MSAVHDHERDELVRIAGLLDHADGPVPADLLPPEQRLRDELEDILARRGRVLVEVDVGDPTVVMTSAPADNVSAQLAAAGVGLLNDTERAVLALVLLRCVVLPTAAAAPPDAWHLADRVPTADIKRSKVPDVHVTYALRTLGFRQLVDAAPAGVKPGPALTRLTPAARRRLEADLVELVAGDDPLIQRVLARVTGQKEART